MRTSLGFFCLSSSLKRQDNPWVLPFGGWQVHMWERDSLLPGQRSSLHRRPAVQDIAPFKNVVSIGLTCRSVSSSFRGIRIHTHTPLWPCVGGRVRQGCRRLGLRSEAHRGRAVGFSISPDEGGLREDRVAGGARTGRGSHKVCEPRRDPLPPVARRDACLAKGIP